MDVDAIPVADYLVTRLAILLVVKGFLVMVENPLLIVTCVTLIIVLSGRVTNVVMMDLWL